MNSLGHILEMRVGSFCIKATLSAETHIFHRKTSEANSNAHLQILPYITSNHT